MQKVDQEIRRIIDEQYAIARKHIESNQDKMHALAKALLEFETLSGEEITGVLKGIKPVREETEPKLATPAMAVPVSTRTDPEPA